MASANQNTGTRKLKIAIFSGAIPSTTFIEHLIKNIAKHHTVLLFGTQKRKVHYNSNSIKIHKTPKPHFSNLLVSSYRVLLLLFTRPSHLIKLVNEIRKYPKLYDRWVWFTKILPIVLYKPDILHIQWARNMEFYAFLRDAYGIKLMLSLRGAHINYSPIVDKHLAEVYRKTFPSVDAFHAVSEAIGIEAEKYYADPLKIKVIHSPISPKFLKAYKVYSKPSRDKIRLLSIGRAHWVKGYHYAVQAISILKQQGYQIEYTIIGVKEKNEALSFQINQLELSQNVHFVSPIPQDELLSKLHEYDALILSSLKEGIANVVLEAMAVGLPVITTDCGGMNEVVTPLKNGFLTAYRNPEALAETIVDFLNTSEEDLKNITERAHNLIRTEFQSEDKINEFLKLYSSVVSEEDPSNGERNEIP